MKKIMIFFTAMLAALIFSSCEKAQLAETAQTGGFKVNVSVAHLGEESATKAVKTGWVTGDRLHVWFDENRQKTPDLIIKYDGTKWARDFDAKVSGNFPSSDGGYMNVAYIASDNLDEYDWFENVILDFDSSLKTSGFHCPLYIAGDITAVLHVDGNDGNPPRHSLTALSSCTYSFSENELSAIISEWEFFTDVQVVISGLSGDWVLGCSEIASYNAREFDFNPAGNGWICDRSFNGKYACGIDNADGLAFYFRSNPYAYNPNSFKFTLFNPNTEEMYSYTANGSIDMDKSKLKAIKIDAYKFVDVSSGIHFGALKGEFSVSDATKVRFSQGNLRYTVNNGVWSFYDNQYDSAPGYESDVISLFSWGYNADHSIIPDDNSSGNVSRTFGNLDLSTEDWGHIIGTPGTWRTLSSDEWRYLFESDTRRYGLSAYNVTVAGKAGCNILYPDGWEGTKVNDNDTTSYDTVEEWEAAEQEGVVCIPPTGSRNSSLVEVLDEGFYWSSTTNDGSYADMINFNGVLKCVSDASRSKANAVRLVTVSDD